VDYQTLIDFHMTSDIFDTYFDEAATQLTMVFSGDYPNDRVVMHTVDPNLVHNEVPLPIPYGKSWLAEDLDLDGNLELILQRGDPGMGGNGYLDIHSAPDWALRTHIVLVGMKVYSYPVALNIDDDPYLELYLTPSSLGGSARAMIIDYDPQGDTFILTDNVAAPASTGGPTAAGDFDEDGKVEFITGNYNGYGLFEYEPAGLCYRGMIPGAPRGSNATALWPRPEATLHALLGHSSFSQGYRYQLMRATGNNTFEVVEVFQETTGYAGIHPCFGLDADCDGMQEFVMGFHPHSRVFEWDTGLEEFREVWSWDETAMGTFVHWQAADCDQDGVGEWCTVDHTNFFRAFEDQDVDPSTVAVGATDGIGLDAALSAWPNPFGRDTRISWRLPGAAQRDAAQGNAARGAQTLTICNVDGRVVRAWNDLPRATDGTLMNWDGRDACGRPVVSGAYVVHARSGSEQHSVRVIIVR
jgi:hypothetical protein